LGEKASKQGTLHNRAPARQVCRKNMEQNAVAKGVFLTYACSIHRRGWSKSLSGIVITWTGIQLETDLSVLPRIGGTGKAP
jgi:hypothetical protein